MITILNGYIMRMSATLLKEEQQMEKMNNRFDDVERAYRGELRKVCANVQEMAM